MNLIRIMKNQSTGELDYANISINDGFFVEHGIIFKFPFKYGDNFDFFVIFKKNKWVILFNPTAIKIADFNDIKNQTESIIMFIDDFCEKIIGLSSNERGEVKKE